MFDEDPKARSRRVWTELLDMEAAYPRWGRQAALTLARREDGQWEWAHFRAELPVETITRRAG